MKETEVKFDYQFNERSKTLTATRSAVQETGIAEYKDIFDEKQTKALFKRFKKERDNTIAMIEVATKQLEEVKKVQETDIVLTDAQKQLIEDLKTLKLYEPVENARVKQENIESQLKALNKGLEGQKKTLNDINNACKMKLN